MNLETILWSDGILIAGFILLIQLLASYHILHTKDNVRSAIAWLGLVWLAPIFGLLAYLLFGVSRIHRRAKLSREKRGLAPRTGAMADPGGALLTNSVPGAQNRWRAHARLSGKVSESPLTEGNSIQPLEGGRHAYDTMIAAIDNAQNTVALTTYIFQADQAGRRFVAALVRAHERGVKICVLVDAVGNLYGFKPVSNLLRRRGVPVAVFNPARFSWRLAFFNLRTHRKLLIIDGHTGFAGGMNIRKHHLEKPDGSRRVRDTHFQLQGPIVTRMMHAFADDWVFSTGKELDEKTWMPPVPLTPKGITARAIADGPDEPNRKVAMILESALASARKHVLIISPYFLPDEALVSALKQAALRGVEIDILVPEKNNLPLFGLSMLSGAQPLLEAGCNLYLSKPPFDHTKLVLVDNCWAFFGSSNWDARSLKLNFEFNIEVHDTDFADTMWEWTQDRLESAKKLTLADLKRMPAGKRFLGRMCWLASPYL